jgi:SSS family solute:Na+ symporter
MSRLVGSVTAFGLAQVRRLVSIREMIDSLNQLDYLVVAGYLIVVLGVGLYVSRFNRETSDYFKGGGHVPWVLSCLSLFVSGFSAFMFVGAAGFTYKNGLAAVLLFGSAFPAYFLGYFVFGKLWRRTRIDTPMQFLTRRYSPGTTYFYTLLSVLPQILRLGISIYTLCIFISSALGFNDIRVDIGFGEFSGLELTMIITGVVLAVYTLFGGLWAVLVTDALQFVILFIATIVILPLAFVQLGDGEVVAGVSRLVAEAPDRFFSFSLENRPPLFWIAYFIGIVLGYNVNWHIGQRYYSVADERDTKKMAFWSAVLSLAFPLMWILPVMASRVLYPDLNSLWPSLEDPSEAAFVTLALDVLPHGMLGVMVAAMFAATMSSADTTFNWLAAVLTKDVFVPLSSKLRGIRPSEKTQLIVGKLSVGTMGVISIWVALVMAAFGGAFDVHVKATSLYAAPMLIPVMLGMVYTRTPWWSGMAAFGIGVLSILIVSSSVNAAQGLPYGSLSDLFLDVEITVKGLRMTRFEIQTLTGTLSSALVFIGSAAFPGRSGKFKARIEALEVDLQTPAFVDVSERVDLRGVAALRITGRLTALLGGLLLLLAVPTFGDDGWSLNLVAGFLCLLVAAGIAVLSSRQELAINPRTQ